MVSFLKKIFAETEDPKFCYDCKFSLQTEPDAYELYCTNMKVVGLDAWALSTSKNKYRVLKSTNTKWERDQYFGACGLKGRLFQPKEVE